jgi:bifunctional non-homologous end joining protein LigD
LTITFVSYIRIAPVLLPHLKNRPITLKRYPDGVDGFFFYEKQCPSHRPAWIKTAEVPSRREEGKIDYCMMNDLPALVWAANLADLELHTFLHRAPAIRRPTALAFDLDPGEPATIVLCCRVALWLRTIFDNLELQAFPKTSGSKGLQIFVPLNVATTYEKTKAFALALAERLQRTSRACGIADAEGTPQRQGAHRLEPERRAQDGGERLFPARESGAECLDSSPMVGSGVGREKRRR